MPSRIISFYFIHEILGVTANYFFGGGGGVNELALVT